MMATIFPVWMWYFLPAGWVQILGWSLLSTLLLMPAAGFIAQEAYPGREVVKKEFFSSLWRKIVSDAVGATVVFSSIVISFFVSNTGAGAQYHDFITAMARNPFSSPDAFLWVTLGIAAALFVNYRLNLKFGYKKLPDLYPQERRLFAIWQAVLTAPYFFYLPEFILYHFFFNPFTIQ